MSLGLHPLKREQEGFPRAAKLLGALVTVDIVAQRQGVLFDPVDPQDGLALEVPVGSGYRDRLWLLFRIEHERALGPHLVFVVDDDLLALEDPFLSDERPLVDLALAFKGDALPCALNEVLVCLLLRRGDEQHGRPERLRERGSHQSHHEQRTCHWCPPRVAEHKAHLPGRETNRDYKQAGERRKTNDATAVRCSDRFGTFNQQRRTPAPQRAANFTAV